MKDPRRRDLMVQFYKLVETFEQPSADPDWWTRLKNATEAFCSAWPDPPLHDLAVELAVALWDAAVHDLALCGSCKTCKNEGKLPAEQCENCGTFDAETGALIDFWEWRGPCAENAQEVSK